MSEDKRSSRTKMLEEAPADSGLKAIFKKGLVGASRLGDKMGFTQEEKYKGKTKEDMQKKAKGGGVKAYKKGGSIDGCAQRGKTRGRMV
jgi:hypothetical protein